MQIRHLPRHCCPVLDNVGSIRLASLEYYTMSMVGPIFAALCVQCKSMADVRTLFLSWKAACVVPWGWRRTGDTSAVPSTPTLPGSSAAPRDLQGTSTTQLPPNSRASTTGLCGNTHLFVLRSSARLVNDIMMFVVQIIDVLRIRMTYVGIFASTATIYWLWLLFEIKFKKIWDI